MPMTVRGPITILIPMTHLFRNISEISGIKHISRCIIALVKLITFTVSLIFNNMYLHSHTDRGSPGSQLKRGINGCERVCPKDDSTQTWIRKEKYRTKIGKGTFDIQVRK